MNDHTTSLTLKLATQITAAAVQSGSLPPFKAMQFFRTVVQEITTMVGPMHTPAPSNNNQPAVPIEMSITEDHLICLEDGKPMKMLKRYLRTRHNLTPDEYREKWGLPTDYPMIAPRSAAQKRASARTTGLGTYSRSKRGR